MAHFILSEDQENDICNAINSLQLIIDLTIEIAPAKTSITIDPRGLTALLSTVQKQLPTDKQMPFICD